MATLALLISVLFMTPQAAARPDFSGQWILDPAKTATTGAPMRVGGPGTPEQPAVQPPRKTKDVPPVYPVDAQRARIGGMVVLEAVIDRQGKVKDLRVLQSVPELDSAAIKAVSQWEYSPTLIAGVPVEIIMTVTLTFSVPGQPLQTGGAAAPAWPTQPAGAARPGMGRGFVSSEIEIKQDDRELTLFRKFAGATEEVRYRFDGRASRNRLPGTGGAVDSTYVYVSRWEKDQLVSTISWTGPQGPRKRTETMWIEGDVLKIQTSRPALSPGGEPFVTTNAFNRKR
jgi:TonB family protein